MDIIFMDSENSNTSQPQRLLLNLTEKYIYKEMKKALLYQILVFIIHGKT